MKKQMVRSIAIIAIIAILGALMPTNVVKAANPSNPKFVLTSTQGAVGDEVTVKVNLEEETTFEDLTLVVEYDTIKLQAISATLGDNMPMIADTAATEVPGKVQMQACDVEDTFTLPAETVLTINFKILEGASGATTLKLLYDTTSTQITTSTVTAIVPITGITLNETEVNLNKGETKDLVATVEPSNTSEDKTVTWTSSDVTVATVANGKVTAVGVGNATITAKAGSKTATCNVTVVSPLEGIELNTSSINLLKNQSSTLIVKYIPEDTTDNRTVTWSTSDATVATVENGVVKALKEGMAVITAKVGEYTAACAVNVTEVPLYSIGLNMQDFELAKGESKNISVIYNPEDTTDDKNVTWSSSNEDVVSVDENGKVTALAVGKAVITAKVGEKTASVEITVPEVLIEGIELTTDKTEILVGEKTNLVVVTDPAEVTEEVNVKYTSSDESILTVDENGVVTGIKAGSATVTVTVNDKFSATMAYTVKEETEEKKSEEENTNKQDDETTTSSILPKTGDIAIGAVVFIMLASAIVAITVIKKNKKESK